MYKHSFRPSTFTFVLAAKNNIDQAYDCPRDCRIQLRASLKPLQTITAL